MISKVMAALAMKQRKLLDALFRKILTLQVCRNFLTFLGKVHGCNANRALVAASCVIMTFSFVYTFFVIVAYVRVRFRIL